MIKNILIINRSDSVCGHCGKGADWSETHHNSQLGWGEHSKEGCGIEWKYLSTHYLDEEFIDIVKGMRPDLKFIHPTETISFPIFTKNDDNFPAQIPKDN